VLLARHEPHRQEPSSKRFVRPVEQGSSDSRCLMAADTTKKEAAPAGPRIASLSTARAEESTWPPEASYVVQACLFGSEPGIKLLERARVIDTSHRSPILAHTEHTTSCGRLSQVHTHFVHKDRGKECGRQIAQSVRT
jgi:hypothetical protein